MYRQSATPTNSLAGGRRSTRSARGSAKRRRNEGSRGGGGGLKRRFERAAERPAKKWVQVFRTPGPRIRFKVASWVPYANLTEQERLEYEARLQEELERRKQQQLEEERRQHQQQLEEKASVKQQPLEEQERKENNGSEGGTTSVPMELEMSKNEGLSESNKSSDVGDNTMTPLTVDSTSATEQNPTPESAQIDSTENVKSPALAEDLCVEPPAKRSRADIEGNAL